MSDWVRNFSPWASSAVEAAKEAKFSTKVAYGTRMMPELRYTHSTEKARGTTLNDEK